MRLFESTGVGTLLLTDWKENLGEIFVPGKEVVAYRTAEECLELLKYYLNHEEARASIARNGQRRTLGEHNYLQRMGEFVEIVGKYL
jgi:spore maturation protein CgeB